MAMSEDAAASVAATTLDRPSLILSTPPGRTHVRQATSKIVEVKLTATGSRPRLMLSPPPGWHRAAEMAVVLIFMFVARAALPILTSGEIHKEVTLGKMWMARQWPGYDHAEHIWQPVSDIPKYGVSTGVAYFLPNLPRSLHMGRFG
jgi:hypothetical protein